jgi:hypothetical protein
LKSFNALGGPDADGDSPMKSALSTIPLTMSALEIAWLTGKAHKHVLRDARKMLEDRKRKSHVDRRTFMHLLKIQNLATTGADPKLK